MITSPAFVALLVTSVMTLCRGQGQDATLIPETHGSAVVDGVVEKIRSRCVFSQDRLFLRRLAYVMSRDGDDSATYRPGFHGGIWQVNETMFTTTQNCSNRYIRDACSNITSAFGIHWSAVTWSDLRKPLYSGLAAALSTLMTLGYRTMPGNVTEQADLWKKMYGGDINTFVTKADSVSISECSDKLDLLFLLDGSGSVKNRDFYLMLKFAADVIDNMNISQDNVLVANIGFSSTVKVEFTFNTYSTKAQLRNAINNTYKENRLTETALGLQQAAKTMYNTRSGARSDAKKVVVLVTDGKSSSFNDTSQAAQALKDLGTTIFAVGVRGYRLEELKAVASDPVCSHVLTLTSFSHIQSILTAIVKNTCEANAKFTETKPFTGILGDQPTTTTTETKVPHNKSVEASVSCGILNIYVSSSDPKPGPALHDDRYLATPSAPATLTLTETLPSGVPLYITVSGTRLPPAAAALRNCSDYSFTIGVVPRKNVTVICEENGVRRPCKPSDVDREKLCDKDDASYPVDNPCTEENLEKCLLRHPYPNDPTKFLQCDMKGNFYVTLCPGGVTFNTQTRQCGFTSPDALTECAPANETISTSTPSSDTTPVPPTPPKNDNNPCTPRALANNEFFHAYSSDETKFIQCDQWGKAWVKNCAPSTIWSQADYTCIKKAKAATRGNTVTCSASDTFLPDPCDHHAYYRCVHGQATRVACHPATLFFCPVAKGCVFTDSNTNPIPASCNSSA